MFRQCKSKDEWMLKWMLTVLFVVVRSSMCINESISCGGTACLKNVTKLRGLGLPPLCRFDLGFVGMLRDVGGQLVADVLGPVPKRR